MDLSIVVPIFNERENIPLLYDRLTTALRESKRDLEVVFVDDGSTDGSRGELAKLAERDQRVKLVFLRRNFGQTAAMQAGFDHAAGDVIVTMDGDLQNDPADIPLMLARLEEGFDLVHGWRKHRQDKWLNRKLPSKIANWLISRTTGFPIHDLGCTLKAIRREVASELELYGEMHRFIPILAYQRGARCVEVETRHHPRQFGKTKYGIGRTFRVVLDLITVKYLLDYFSSPMKLFGRFGLAGLNASMCLLMLAVGMKVFGGADMTANPLLLLSVVAGIVSLQFFSLGLLGEVSARIYYSCGSNRSYAVRRLVNFSDDAAPLKMPPGRESRRIAG
jgi:glycosyltransferase involved in cell wall biosynthesis